MSKRKVFLVTSNDPWEVVALGFAGENLARTVEWDIGPWVETYGEGEVQLLAKRPVDKDPYPVVVTRDGNSVLWTVRKEDLWYGNKLGQAQLFYLVDGQVVARSKAFRTMTREAIEGDVQECSEPERDWVEQVLRSVAAAEESAGAAEISAESAVKSAEAASISEEITGMYAEEAKEIVTGAEKTMEEFAATAVEKATIASESAVKAQNAASTASMAAGNAQTAQEKAEEAQVAAENAQIASEAAKMAAETAASEAQETVDDQKKILEINTIKKTKFGEVIVINNSAACKLQKFKLYGKSIQNETSSLETPVKIEDIENSKNISIIITSYQLLNFNVDQTYTDTNGVFTSGNSYQTCVLFLPKNTSIHIAGDFTLLNNNVIRVGWFNSFPKLGAVGIRSNLARESTLSASEDTYIAFSFIPKDTQNLDIFFDKILKSFVINYGDNGFPWEPYKSQILSFCTLSDFLGIPVDSGGNYIDATGQQWLCDEMDFGCRKYVQRIGKIDYYINENIGDIYMSTTGQLSDGATVIYPLETPIEMDLPEEVMDAYHQLTMYYPNTTITTDSYPPAGISVEYIADTKTYIDQKYDSLQKQLDILIGADT